MIDILNLGLNNNGLESAMKLIFKNNEISIFSSLTKTNNGTVIDGSFYVSNNTNKGLQNIKINFLVPKYINLKVLSNSGTSLDSNQSLGIKKVKFFFNLIIYFRK
jgi:hypothetical protein